MRLAVQTGNVVDDFGFEAGYRMIKEAGFEAVDWNIDHAWDQSKLRKGELTGCIFEKSPEEVLEYYRRELEIIRANGLAITQAHAPFPAYLEEVPELLDYAIEIYKGCIRLCDAAGCKNLVVHGISASPKQPGLSLKQADVLNMKLYQSLIPVLKETQVTVCLENLFTGADGQIYEGTCSDAGEAVRYIDALNAKAGRECFGLCVDTGHLNLLRKNVTEYIRTVGKRIACLHVHDNDGRDDLHRMPFTGTLRWEDLLAALREVGYSGDLSFETFAQVTRNRMGPEYVAIYLETIARVGKIFIEKITA